MGFPQQLSLSAKRAWSRAPALAGPSPSHTSDGKLEVALIFTSPQATIAALERTATLLSGLDARINLVAAQIVPYPLPVDNPPVSVEFNEQRLLQIARRSPIETVVHLCLCRNRFETLTSVLRPGSVLIIGGRKRWWLTWERKLARKLEYAGFQILLLELG
jgi:hypothetical protein